MKIDFFIYYKFIYFMIIHDLIHRINAIFINMDVIVIVEMTEKKIKIEI